MVFRKALTILLLLLCMFNAGFGQKASEYLWSRSVRFNTIDVKDGLSHNWIRCIYQDDQGFMWFGTSGDLNKYNGYDFEVYNLGNVNVNVITRKSSNELWIGNDLGVYIYNRENDTMITFHHLKGKTILSILKEEDGTVWFGSNTGLYRYTLSNDQIKVYTSESKNSQGLFSNYINTIFRDSDNNIWIGTNAGLNRYNRTTDSFEQYSIPSEDRDVFAICEDHDKRLWFGSAKDGLYLLKENNGKSGFLKIADGAVQSLLADDKNFLWVGLGSGGGLLKIDLVQNFYQGVIRTIHISANKSDPYGLSDNSVFCIYQDRLHDIWIGTFTGGINFFSYRSKKFNAVQEGIPDMIQLKNNFVNAILEDEKYLWIGTEGGLEQYNKQTNQNRHFSYMANNPSSLSSNPVYALYRDSRDNVWVGTWTGGLNLYNNRDKTFKRFVPDGKPGSIGGGNVFVIFEDSRGYLWIGTVGGGLSRYDYKTGTFKVYRHDPQIFTSLYSNIIHDICEMRDGRLLVAAYGSLDILDVSSDDIKHVPLTSLFPEHQYNRYIITIYADSRHHIWLGSNEGLLMMNEEMTSTVYYSKQHGLAGNTIKGIVEDKRGNLWISTNSGLTRFNNAVNNPNKADFTNFDESDGLSGNEFKNRAIFQNQSGILFFGTSQGLTWFHPDSIQLNQNLPAVVLSKMDLIKNGSGTYNNIVSNIDYKDRVELPFKNSDFEISFAALNYLDPHKNKYKYMLSGYDHNWIESGNHRTATYKNLKPGNYTFMVLGSNNDEQWSKSPKTLDITVTPPFWQTLGFRIAFLLFFLGIMFLIFKWRDKSMRREKRKLEKIISERTIELLDANKKLEEQSEELSTQNDELKQNQEQLSLYKDQLEELVVERTAELEKAKLKAEESDRLKTMFLANMSHEIRTPLNAIAGFSNLISDPEIDSEERKSYNQIIQSNTQSLLQLINDILDLSTIAANQLKFSKAPFSPAGVLAEVYQQFLPQTSNEVQLILKIEEKSKLVMINSDEYRFRQILINLISNAFKFTEKGYIETGFFRSNHHEVTFYVKDTGIGISKEEQEVIFNHFTKVENTKKLFRGAGLGLAICRQLTELLEGKIWLESEKGVGSTFYFSQPVYSQV